MKLSVVLPVFNQADHIARIVQGYSDALERLGCTFELILVPNGCTDQSVSVCESLSAEDARIRTIALNTSGWGLAVISGLRAATGEVLCYTNTARTSADLLANCVKRALAQGNLVVKVTRIERRGSRYWGSKLYNAMGRVLFELRCGDINGTPKLFPAEFGHLRDLRETGDLLDLEFMVCCARHGYGIVEIAAPWGGRHGGVSTTSLNSAYRMYLGLVKYWWKDRWKHGKRSCTN
jgi:glycosyltransferase involved in cell wall biosynthesis